MITTMLFSFILARWHSQV